MTETIAPLSGPVAQPVATVTVRYFGPTGGNAAWYYWVQALFPGGYSALSPYGLVTQSQPSLNRDMFNVVTWDDVVGAIAYKVWRTPTATAPTTGPYMLAVVGNATTVVTDNGINWQISTDTVEVGIDVNGNANISGSYLVNGTPISGGAGTVASVFGRQGAVVAVAGDYTAAMVTNAVDSTQAYPNPTWITSLDAGKLTGTPPAAVIAATQTPWLQNINGGNFQLANVGKVGVGNTAATLPDGDVSAMHLMVGNATTNQYGEISAIGNVTNTSYPVGLVNFANYNIAGTEKRLALLLGATDGAVNNGYLAAYTMLAGTVTERMRISSAGNVGIGTTSPNAPLSFGPVSYTPPLGTAYNQFQIILYDGGVPGQTYGIGVEGNNVGFNSNGGYKFYQKAGVSPIMVIGSQTTLNVGIGTTSPTYKLDISGASVATSQVHISYDGAVPPNDNGGYLCTVGGASLYITAGAAYSAGSLIAKGANWEFIDLVSGTFSVFLGTTGVAGSAITLGTPVLYASGANVGINTSSPTASLDVAGTMAVHGLPSAAPAAGSKQFWYDPADSNRVKYVP